MTTTVRVEVVEADAVVNVTGEVDVVGSRLLLDTIVGDTIPWATARRLVLDLGSVSFLDSSGLGVLVQAREMCTQRDVELVLRAVPGRVMKVLAITGLTASFGLGGPADA